MDGQMNECMNERTPDSETATPSTAPIVAQSIVLWSRIWRHTQNDCAVWWTSHLVVVMTTVTTETSLIYLLFIVRKLVTWNLQLQWPLMLSPLLHSKVPKGCAGRADLRCLRPKQWRTKLWWGCANNKVRQTKERNVDNKGADCDLDVLRIVVCRAQILFICYLFVYLFLSEHSTNL